MKILSEILDSHYPFKKRYSKNESGAHGYEFSSPHGKYGVGFIHSDPKDSHRTVDVIFHKGGEMGMTGEEGSHAHKVISTVMHIAKTHMKDYPDHDLQFFGDKESVGRTKLYNRLTKLHGGKVNRSFYSIHQESKSLDEILDSHYPFEKIHDKRYKFKSPKGNYSVDFHHYKDSVTGKNAVSLGFDHNNGGIHKTGEEGVHAHKIISTVMHITKTHMKDYPDHDLNFTSSEPGSRTKLYNKLTRMQGGKYEKVINKPTITKYSIHQESKSLDEILDSHYPFKKLDKKKDSGYHNYNFNSPKGNYAVDFYHYKYAPKVELTFDHNGITDMTGEEGAHAHKVISTVMHIAKTHMKDYPGHDLDFSGAIHDKGRTKLYDKMTKKQGGEIKSNDYGSSYSIHNESMDNVYIEGQDEAGQWNRYSITLNNSSMIVSAMKDLKKSYPKMRIRATDMSGRLVDMLP